MTNKQVINFLDQVRKILLDDKSWLELTTQPINAAFDMAISALEKQIPKKPIWKNKNDKFDGNWIQICPTCGRVLVEHITTPEKSRPIIYNMSDVCLCGQQICWENE